MSHAYMSFRGHTHPLSISLPFLTRRKELWNHRFSSLRFSSSSLFLLQTISLIRKLFRFPICFVKQFKSPLCSYSTEGWFDSLPFSLIPKWIYVALLSGFIFSFLLHVFSLLMGLLEYVIRGFVKTADTWRL